ncbi:hypothetical protein KFL_000250090 [Klebsormidium nitens]|uniref:Uncharacterized protein n=1 Tax=Klebsormidium nitens TaxID=105231 RepID=A0A1Y1HN34_KLENI|nr:hypothetical protein KFL_000250090 [Klebsormidium nitens]|eukprot:GAQ79132.1 hypothetical protein KFL_000250090 [Klebsormidium nitens]
MKRGFLLGQKQDPLKHARTGDVGGGEGVASASAVPSGYSRNAPEEASGTDAQEALACLENLCKNPRGHDNPPNMDYIWEDDYEEELLQCTEAALSARVAPAKVQQMIAEAADRDLLGYVPSKLQRAISERLSPDAMVGGQSFLHQLFNQDYPPQPEAWGQEGEDLTLPQLLKKGPTPDKRDSRGETILHVLIRRTINGNYFPDDSTSGMMYSGDIERWADRAKHFEPTFKMLVDAGWTMHVCDAKGVSVLKRLRAAKAQAQRLVGDSKVKGMSATFATIPSLRAGGGKVVEKLLKDRNSMLQAFANAPVYVEERGLA